VGVAGLAELGQAKAAQVRAVDLGVAGDVLFLLVDELAGRGRLPRPEETPQRLAVSVRTALREKLSFNCSVLEYSF